MKLTVSMTAAVFRQAAKTGENPDYADVFSDVDGVQLLSISGRGRYAKVEVTGQSISDLEEQFKDRFVFCEDVGVELFGNQPKRNVLS